jgi:hypothetical protein
MDLMSNAEEWFWLLMALVQAMPTLGWWLAERLALISKSGPKVMAFVVMKPCQLPLDP